MSCQRQAAREVDGFSIDGTQEIVEGFNRVERVETCRRGGTGFDRVERVETCRRGGTGLGRVERVR